MGVFAVLVTGPPGSGKTSTLTALSDALVDDGVPHAAVDVDEVAWVFPFPALAQRCAHLRAWRDSHLAAGTTLFVVAEVIESRAHLDDVLAALGVDDHVLVRLDARLPTLRERIVTREPEGWSGLDRLLAETERLSAELRELDGAHLVLDTEQLSSDEVAHAVRAARPDVLAAQD